MNTKMKALSLALVGLAGFAGSAMAACPAGPDIANGGAWDSVLHIGGTAAIATPGYAGTECRLDSTINAGAGSSSVAAVIWSPTGATPEPSYRAQFIVDLSTIAAPGIADASTIYSATSGTGGAGVRFTVFGSGGAPAIGYSVRYDDASGRRFRTGTVPLPAAASGRVHVEFSLGVATSPTGTDGTFNLWVENNTEATPTKTETGLANGALTGIDKAQLGLSGPSSAFVTHFAGQAVGFDQYDSRRTTFIGF